MVIPRMFQRKLPRLGNHRTCPTHLPSKPIPAAKHCLWQRQVCMILPRDTVYSPGLCFLAGRSQAHGLLAHTQHGMWPTCFCLAPTPAAAQLRGSPGRVKSSPNLMGFCSTHAPSALCRSQREAVSEQPDLFPKQGICSYTSNVKKENLLFYLQQSSISLNLNKYN